MTEYDQTFFDSVNDAGSSSAEVVVPLLMRLVKPSSVVDVGCGTGIWVQEFIRAGLGETVGVDGAYVPAGSRRLEPANFVEADLTQPLELGDRRDLATCLEVAEHLQPESALTLVESLVRGAPAVVFSAAVPGQGGTHHVNEQWPDYWISRFEAHGWTCWDVLRRQLRYDSRVAWIYRQNLMLMLSPEHPLKAEMRPEDRLQASPVDVHFEYVSRYVLSREPSAKEAVRRLIVLAGRRARRR